jgi:hypothetical protein
MPVVKSEVGSGSARPRRTLFLQAARSGAARALTAI